MYINAVANSVSLQLHLRNDFHNIIFKIEQKLHTASRSGHTLSVKILRGHLSCDALSRDTVDCNFVADFN